LVSITPEQIARRAVTVARGARRCLTLAYAAATRFGTVS
jgi:hypothetical protein